jgi:transposase
MHATTTYGLDVAKRVFQMHWVDNESGEIINRRFGRDDLIQYLSRQSPARVALEACGSAHWWARKIKALGHDVVLLHAKFIRPFVQTNKTDAADARAIWTAVQQPGMRTVAVKTEDQQAMLSLHRIRSLERQIGSTLWRQLEGWQECRPSIDRVSRSASRQQELPRSDRGIPTPGTTGEQP